MMRNRSPNQNNKTTREAKKPGIFARIFPNLRRGNQPDMPFRTNHKLWFLQENRFLFFTRGGPVEITLKPTFVLAAVIVGMAGITTIFYSTLIASYSAIEVMREETIQTANASIDNFTASNRGNDLLVPSQSNSSDRNNGLSLSGHYSKSPIEQSSKRSAIEANKASKISDALQEFSDTRDREMPMIMQRGKLITLENRDTLVSTKKHKEYRKTASDGSINADTTDYKDKNENILKPKNENLKLDSGTVLVKTDTETQTAKITKTVNEKSKKAPSFSEPGLSEKVRNITLAMIPRFLSRDPVSSFKQKTEEEIDGNDKIDKLSVPGARHQNDFQSEFFPPKNGAVQENHNKKITDQKVDLRLSTKWKYD